MNLDEKLKALGNEMVPDDLLVQKTVEDMKQALYHKANEKKQFHTAGLVRLCIASALLLLIISATIYAAASGWFSRLSALFSQEFGIFKEQEDFFDNYSGIIGSSQAQNGLIISAEAYINDGNILVLAFSVRKEDGTSLLDSADTTGRLVLGSASFEADQDIIWISRQRNESVPGIENYIIRSEAYHYEYFLLTDNIPTFIDISFSDPEIWTESSRIRLMEDTDSFHEWDFHVPIKEISDTQRSYVKLGEKDVFTANGEIFQIKGIYLSPLSLVADYQVISDTPTRRVTHPDGKTDYYNDTPFWMGIDLELKLMDGRVVNMSADASQNDFSNPLVRVRTDTVNDIFQVFLGGLLPESISLDEVQSVIFNGAEYLLPETQ